MKSALFLLAGAVSSAAILGTLPQSTQITTAEKQYVDCQFPPEVGEVIGRPEWRVVDDSVVTLEVSDDGLSACVVSEDTGTTWVVVTAMTWRDNDIYYVTSTFKAEVLADPPPELPFWFTFSSPVPK